MEFDRMGRLVGFGPIVAAVAILLAGGLAIAGFGVPVGVGLLAGTALGFGVGFIVELSIHGPRTFNRLVRRGNDGWTAEASGNDRGRQEEFMANHQRLELVEKGRLRQVVAGGGSAAARGVAIELIALEARTSGAIVHLASHLDPDRALPGPLVRATVTDDVGTEYSSGGLHIGGGRSHARYWLAILPAPPPDARRLEIRIEELVNPFELPPDFPVPDRPTDVSGPWILEADLTAST